MPLTQQFHTPSGGTLYLWRVSERTDHLLQTLSMTDKAKEEWRNITHPKRQREWLVARHLFHELQIHELLRYRDNGKPYLKDGRKISISHSHDLVGAFIHNDKEVGIDIQAPDEKLVKISSRFCNQREFDFASNSINPIEVFTVIWSAKEAVFKVFGENIHFAKQMAVRPFELKDPKIFLDFRVDNSKVQTFKLAMIKLNDYFILIAEDS